MCTQPFVALDKIVHACDVDECEEDAEEDHEAELEVCEHEGVDDDDAHSGHPKVPDHLVPDRLVRRPGRVGLYEIVEVKLYIHCTVCICLNDISSKQFKKLN